MRARASTGVRGGRGRPPRVRARAGTPGAPAPPRKSFLVVSFYCLNTDERRGSAAQPKAWARPRRPAPYQLLATRAPQHGARLRHSPPPGRHCPAPPPRSRPASRSPATRGARAPPRARAGPGPAASARPAVGRSRAERGSRASRSGWDRVRSQLRLALEGCKM